jgi:hypothetical protein
MYEFLRLTTLFIVVEAAVLVRILERSGAAARPIRRAESNSVRPSDRGLIYLAA